jgi:hypothetical protein
MRIVSGSLERRGGDAPSAGLQPEHSLDVPAHRHQVPFAFDVIESAKQALSVAHDRFDDPEHRFWRVFAQRVEFSSPGCIESVRHPLQRCGGATQRLWSGGEALFPADVMLLTPRSDQGFDFGRLASLDVDLAEVPSVGKYGACQEFCVLSRLIND